ncbi:peptidase inhibitor family I36 protein [Kitasatospora sp. RB6PN24]|uniref:peptidase inhibitor family I36 protein n=1 Tax=Kitasatospora humi TaxID=2893891 RepID=UPI001E5D4300|nr:peptidase inhibitor family I36 protein [Kitasatospora humi]MCC9307244.1 peptidase inhibitor family I36 protein [Kitasatospora humi]
MKRRISFVLGTAVLAGLAVLPTQTATADVHRVRIVTGQGSVACTDGFVCLYENSGLNQPSPGRVLLTDGNIGWLSDYGFNDITSSVCNHTGVRATLYADSGMQGDWIMVDPGTCNNVPDWFNDTASSLHLN